jgi:hypothetical protein
MWEPRRLTILWASTAYYRDSFTFTIFILFRLVSSIRQYFLTYVVYMRKYCDGEKFDLDFFTDTRVLSPTEYV